MRLNCGIAQSEKYTILYCIFTRRGIYLYELFFKKFNEKVSLNAEEEEIIKSYLTPRKLRRKQYLLRAGDVCKGIAFC